MLNYYATINGEKSRRTRKKNKKEEHRDLTWFDKLPTSTETGKKRIFTMLKLGLYKRVFILTLRNENSKNTPESYSERQPQPMVHPTTHLPLFLHMSFHSNMSHILQQNAHT